jgi:hypothetical protein
VTELVIRLKSPEARERDVRGRKYKKQAGYKYLAKTKKKIKEKKDVTTNGGKHGSQK